jgi:hypothetical protein
MGPTARGLREGLSGTLSDRRVLSLNYFGDTFAGELEHRVEFFTTESVDRKSVV